MISRDAPFYDFACDRCSVGAERVEAPTVRQAIGAAVRRGWRCFRRKGGETEHICPDCFSEGKERS